MINKFTKIGHRKSLLLLIKITRNNSPTMKVNSFIKTEPKSCEMTVMAQLWIKRIKQANFIVTEIE